MSRQARTLEKRLQASLRECQKQPGNKRCADCTERVSAVAANLVYVYGPEHTVCEARATDKQWCTAKQLVADRLANRCSYSK